MRKHYRVMELCLLSNLSFDKKEKPLPDGRGLSRKREEKGERNSYEFPRSGDRGARVERTGLDEFLSFPDENTGSDGIRGGLLQTAHDGICVSQFILCRPAGR